MKDWFVKRLEMTFKVDCNFEHRAYSFRPAIDSLNVELQRKRKGYFKTYIDYFWDNLNYANDRKV